MLLNGEGNKLFYLNFHVEDDSFHPITIPHIVDLDTLTVTPFSIEGTYIHITDISRDWSQVAMILDDDPEARVGIIWGAGAVLRVFDPRFIVYDITSGEIVYESRSLLETNEGLYEPVSWDIDFYARGFEWTEQGWHTILRTDNAEEAPFLIDYADGQITETQLVDTPNSYLDNTEWSADGSEFFVQLADNTSYVVGADGSRVTQVTQAIDLKDVRLNIEWYEDTHQLVVEFVDSGSLIIEKRWLVDPTRTD
jgi:hypothetical protein